MVLPETAVFIIPLVTGAMLPNEFPPAVQPPDSAREANPVFNASSRHDYANGVLRAVRPATQIGPEWRAAGSACVAQLSFGATGLRVTSDGCLIPLDRENMRAQYRCPITPPPWRDAGRYRCARAPGSDPGAPPRRIRERRRGSRRPASGSA